MSICEMIIIGILVLLAVFLLIICIDEHKKKKIGLENEDD